MESAKIISKNRHTKRLHLQKNRMYTDHEKRFMEWWSENRLREKRTLKQWLMGIPVGLLFAIPISVELGIVAAGPTLNITGNALFDLKIAANSDGSINCLFVQFSGF